MPGLSKHPHGVHAGSAFGLLAAVFVTVFGTALLLLADDQQRVIDANSRLQERTVPEIIRYQRLARNLEQLRQEGERIFAVSSHAPRQQAMFVVTLVASHPSVLEHPAAAQLARETEQFLGKAVRQSATDEKRLAAHHAEWQRLAARLGMQVDDVSVEGINQATSDLEQASAAMQLARYKLIVVMVLVGLFLFAFIFLVRRHLIHPLQRIDHALSNVQVPIQSACLMKMVKMSHIRLNISVSNQFIHNQLLHMEILEIIKKSITKITSNFSHRNNKLRIRNFRIIYDVNYDLSKAFIFLSLLNPKLTEIFKLQTSAN
jgi:hypothetical protein